MNSATSVGKCSCVPQIWIRTMED